VAREDAARPMAKDATKPVFTPASLALGSSHSLAAYSVEREPVRKVGLMPTPGVTLSGASAPVCRSSEKE